MAHQLAVESGHVVADVVDVSELPEVGSRYAVTTVPKLLVNGSAELLGSLSEEKLLDTLGV